MTKEMIANRKRGIMLQIKNLDADIKAYMTSSDETDKEMAKLAIEQKNHLFQMYGKLEAMELDAE